MKNLNAKLIVMTASVMISFASLSSELIEREYKNGCHKTYGDTVIVQKKQNKYTLKLSVGEGYGQKSLTLFGDSFALHFEKSNTNTSLFYPEDIKRSIVNADESIMFTCPGINLVKEKYVTYDLDVDTYEILIQQKYLRKTKRMSYY